MEPSQQDEETEDRGDGGDRPGSVLLAKRMARIALRCSRPLRRPAIIGMIGLVMGVAVLGSAWALSRPSVEVAITALPAPSTYVNLPAFVTDLRPDRGRRAVVRIALVVRVPAAHAPQLTDMNAAIEDAVQVHLRDYRRRDLEGAEGAQRLRQEVLEIVNALIHPAKADRILFREFLMD
ncbi:MAG: hypothetical protein EA405_02155 [Rhodospirillales bacterium]|nr:MAG: hypothetical protein EA405_02155 [Rhodospirillales bacterium]